MSRSPGTLGKPIPFRAPKRHARLVFALLKHSLPLGRRRVSGRCRVVVRLVTRRAGHVRARRARAVRAVRRRGAGAAHGGRGQRASGHVVRVLEGLDHGLLAPLLVEARLALCIDASLGKHVRSASGCVWEVVASLGCAT